MTSYDELDHLRNFLQNEPLNKITVARAFHELWKCKDIQSEESDSNCLLEVFKELTAENLNSDRKQYFTSLQDIDKDKLYKFCIVFGINITDDHCVDVYGLLREKGIKFYLPIIKAKIPLHNETVDKVEEFVHALLILRNGLLVNLHEFNQILLKKSRSATEQHDSSEEDSTIRTS
ncbi:hypothetical protein G9A89_021253 [Geosiphon pyriformis]|nr:hypothetical protein G9A89_021253 [Geosiphon pyriformis]